MKKLLLIMAVSACASVARAGYVTYYARVDDLGSDCTAATLEVHNADNDAVLSQNITSENFDTKGKAPSKSINFTSETEAKTVYCIITTTTEKGNASWKSKELTYSTDNSTLYYTPMYQSYRQMSWTFGSNPESNGWTVATVPEPTSGLLMLLGMAGLALRRRRA